MSWHWCREREEPGRFRYYSASVFRAHDTYFTKFGFLSGRRAARAVFYITVFRLDRSELKRDRVLTEHARSMVVKHAESQL